MLSGSNNYVQEVTIRTESTPICSLNLQKVPGLEDISTSYVSLDAKLVSGGMFLAIE